MYQTIYEIPDKIVNSTMFNALFYVLCVCTVLMALSWIGFYKDKKFWKWVVVLFNLMVVVLWVVHITVVFDIKKQYVDAYKQGKYLTVEGVLKGCESYEEGGKFTVSFTDANGKTSELNFFYPHSSEYGYKGDAELENGDRVRVCYVVDNSMSDNTDPKCIVRLEKQVTETATQ